MNKQSLKVSIVIPAYNEQDHIGSCLEAIVELQEQPYEVIVVDNCSTDKTAEIVENYPFVKLIKEPRQGVVFARDCGFDYASGDIIGRIDADTLLPDDWISKVKEIFSDSSVQAVSGGLHFYDIGCSKVIDRIDAYWRSWMANRMSPNSRIFLFGSNMAIRRGAWQQVRVGVCRERGLHEDLDLALHMSAAKLKVVFEPTLMANVSARRIDTGLSDLARYAMLNPKTYLKHNAREHLYMYPLIGIVLMNYLLLRLLFRAFDKQAQRFSLRLLLLSQSAARVNPADYS